MHGSTQRPRRLASALSVLLHLAPVTWLPALHGHTPHAAADATEAPAAHVHAAGDAPCPPVHPLCGELCRALGIPLLVPVADPSVRRPPPAAAPCIGSREDLPPVAPAGGTCPARAPPPFG
jgi:hypothetical protein